MRTGAGAWVLGLAVFGVAGCDGESGTQASGAFGLTCSASPTAGVAPLAVSLVARASGAPAGAAVSFDVNYGDGTASNEPVGGHLYQQPGAYTVRFVAVTGTARAECSVGIAVASPPAGPLAPSGNAPPTAVFKTNPFALGGTVTGAAPLAVTFNMCPTVDTDQDLLLFTMDFTSDGVLEVQGTTGSDCRREAVYGAPGDYQATLCVADVSPSLVPLHRSQCEAFTITVTP